MNQQTIDVVIDLRKQQSGSPCGVSLLEAAATCPKKAYLKQTHQGHTQWTERGTIVHALFERWANGEFSGTDKLDIKVKGRYYAQSLPAALGMFEGFRRFNPDWIARHAPTYWAETVYEYTLSRGHTVTVKPDLLVKTADGFIAIDYKTTGDISFSWRKREENRIRHAIYRYVLSRVLNAPVVVRIIAIEPSGKSIHFDPLVEQYHDHAILKAIRDGFLELDRITNEDTETNAWACADCDFFRGACPGA